MYLYDMDVVENSNLSGQFYSMSNVGEFKRCALLSSIRSYSGCYSQSIYEEYTETSSKKNIMICGFDNMAARKLFYNNWKSHIGNLSEQQKDKCLFMDGRLTADCFQIFCIQGRDTYNMEKYEKEYLFSDEEADNTVCSFKQTSFMANMIASYMTNLFVNFVANMCDPIIPKDVPFYTEYTSDNLYTKVIF